jgi:hypothetical protein
MAEIEITLKKHTHVGTLNGLIGEVAAYVDAGNVEIEHWNLHWIAVVRIYLGKDILRTQPSLLMPQNSKECDLGFGQKSGSLLGGSAVDAATYHH